jgi:2'-hydroxyisoflavone reductase
MRLLVLGGSWFVGSAIVDRACASGHEVTVFNRGRTPITYPDSVRQVHGDREDAASLARLAGQGPWDVVIDVAGAVPAVVRDSARALSGVADRYVFVSTVSAYRDWPHQPVTEISSLHVGDPDADLGVRRWEARLYGPLKAGCEAAIAREYAPDQTLTVRPGVVLGPREYVGRVPWWLSRMRRGGRVLAPGRPDRPIQPVDVRDLAAFLLDLIERAEHGVYNVAAPQHDRTYEDLLLACARAVGTAPEITWVDEQWLVGRGVRQWTELPLWRVPAGTWAMEAGKALERGLVCRPLDETARDVWAWWNSGGQPVEHERWDEHGIAADREAALLKEWDERQATAPLL